MAGRITEERRGGGFTLIELLVVVAIIALLIAILIPSLSRAREQAKLAVCQTRLHGWGHGFIMYCTDWDGNLPMDGGDATTSKPIGKWSDTWLWFNGVVQYMGTGNLTYDQLQTNSKVNGTPLPKAGNNSFFVCPTALDIAGGSGDDTTTFPGYFNLAGWYSTSPVFTENRKMLLCYGMNSQLRQWTMDFPDYPDRKYRQPDDISRITRLTPAALVPLVAEKRINPDEIPSNDTPNYTKDLAQSKVTSNRFAARHSKGGSIVFADGHVEWLENKKISHGPGAVKNPPGYYNYPGVVIWNPLGVGGQGN